MKKILSFALCLALLLGLCSFSGCGKDKTLSATGEYNGQRITMSYDVHTDVPYFADTTAICVENGYAVFYDMRAYDEKSYTEGNCGWNAMDMEGNILFEKPYAVLTHFDADGYAMAWKFPRFPEAYVFVNAAGEETEATLEQLQSFDPTARGWRDYALMPPSISVAPWSKYAPHSYVFEGLAVYAEYAPDLPGENDHLLGLIDAYGEILIPAFIPTVWDVNDTIALNEDKLIINDNGKIGIISIYREGAEQGGAK